MQAFQIIAINRCALAEVADPVPAAGEVRVDLKAAALNHRDLWIKLGQYAGLTFPCIPGSDGAGVVGAVGAGVDQAWAGKDVIINPAFDWGDNPRTQGAKFTILGLPRAGTLAHRVVVPVEQLSERPSHLAWPAAAALPLAGLTAWRALVTRAGCRAGDRVLVTGIGGGVALFVLQFAVAAGAEVWVTSSSEAKIDRAKALGARGGFVYTQPEWATMAARAGGGFDIICDSAGGEGFNDLIDLAAPGGRIVFYGATRGNPSALALRKIFWRQLSLLGTTMGDPADWEAMTAFVSRHRIAPVVSEVFPLARVDAALALMERGGQFGKIVIEIA